MRVGGGAALAHGQTSVSCFKGLDVISISAHEWRDEEECGGGGERESRGEGNDEQKKAQFKKKKRFLLQKGPSRSP